MCEGKKKNHNFLTYRNLWLCYGPAGCRGKIQECSGRLTASVRATPPPGSIGEKWWRLSHSCSSALWTHCTTSAMEKNKLSSSSAQLRGRQGWKQIESRWFMSLPQEDLLPSWWAPPQRCSLCRTERGRTDTASRKRGYSTAPPTDSSAGLLCGSTLRPAGPLRSCPSVWPPGREGGHQKSLR